MLPMNKTAVRKETEHLWCLSLNTYYSLYAAFRCQPNEFQCEINNKCILKIWRCDGEIDCSTDAADSSDEKHCGKNYSRYKEKLHERRIHALSHSSIIDFSSFILSP